MGQDRPVLSLQTARRCCHRRDRQGRPDFQDDMLDVLDQMSFDIIEIDKT